jgi:murein DD-endopeptidase MepM/ murein hydrolase activator NlpD
VRYLDGAHKCAEFKAPEGTPVLASADGEVVQVTDTAEGRVVIIRHDSIHSTVYANLAGLDVEPGMQVRKGEIIGRTGIAAATGESMLHFEVLRFGQPVDPEGFLQESIIM